MSERIIIGCMSGTSLDGVDAVKLKVSKTESGLNTEILEAYDKSYSFGINQELKHLSLGQPSSVQHILKLQRDISNLHNDVIEKFSQDYELIVLHGQTIFHDPPVSWQMIQPHYICAKFNKPCLFDLRMADIARGGQGAPISPLADAHVFHSENESRAIINLGGFINITKLPKGKLDSQNIEGFDLCICNQWLDQLSQNYFQKPFDTDGENASQGKPIKSIVKFFYDFFKSQWEHQRSLGSRDDQNHLLKDELLLKIDAHDILNSSCHALATLIVEACKDIDQIILAGGGCQNKALVNCIEQHSSVPVNLSDKFGMPFQQREAAHMALLGYLCLEKQAITLPNITGCDSQQPFLSGSWVYP